MDEEYNVKICLKKCMDNAITRGLRFLWLIGVENAPFEICVNRFKCTYHALDDHGEIVTYVYFVSLE